MKNYVFILLLFTFCVCVETTFGETNTFRGKRKKESRKVTKPPKKQPPPSVYPQWSRSIKLSAIVGTDSDATATFFNRNKRINCYAKVNEIIPNTSSTVIGIDTDKNIVTVEENGNEYELKLRYYQSGLEFNKDGKIKLNFEETDLRAVLVFLSELTGENIIFGNGVKGPVTVITPSPVTRQEAIKIIYSALEMLKYTIVREGGIAKVIKSGDAKQSPILVSTNSIADVDVNDLIRAQVVYPKNISASEIKRFIDPMMTKGCGQVVINENLNNVILIDTGTNIKKLMGIIEIIDKPKPIVKDKSADRKLYTFKLKNADAGEVSRLLNNLLPGSYNLGISESTDTLFIKASENIYKQILEIIKKADVPVKSDISTSSMTGVKSGLN